MRADEGGRCKKSPPEGRRCIPLSIDGTRETGINGSHRGNHCSHPVCPVYQNVSTVGESDPPSKESYCPTHLPGQVDAIGATMIADNATEFVELGPGSVLQGLITKIDKSVTVSGKN